MEHFTFSAWNIEAETGYKPKTTFWQDFSIADRFGADAVKDTFNRAFAEWKTDHVYLTELSQNLAALQAGRQPGGDI